MHAHVCTGASASSDDYTLMQLASISENALAGPQNVTHALRTTPDPSAPRLRIDSKGGGTGIVDDTEQYGTLVRRQLALLGEDPRREGLLKTPERVEKSMRWLTRGYELQVEDVFGDAIFEQAHENMVLVRDIEFYSLCEHHMLPFFGKVHVAYIPNGRIVGLSKLPRLVDMFARRLQVQERLTEEIAGALEQFLKPRGVGVVIEASHLCMMMRGVEKQNSRTITSALRGEFRTCPMTRTEFLRLAHLDG
jgi:GTP cyclohydrolase I